MTHRMGFWRLHNAELIEFLSLVLQTVAESGALPPKLAETVAVLRTRLAELEAMHKADPSSLFTGELLLLDEERDDLYTGLLAFCRAFAWHNNEALVGHGAALVHCIDNYGTAAEVARMPYSKESATIESLLADLARPELHAAITATGAGLWIAPLKAANDRFRERFIDRNDEQQQKEFLLSMKQQRGATAIAYDGFIKTLNAAIIMGDAGLGELAGKIQLLTESQQHVLAQRAGRAKAAKAPDATA
ncbi:DUF6261 family protein [Flaviaesturariibacter aridisoli]|uniref:Uncharacterized protein n=1 Tax=Flaviaesturariibacter aridisoli TaxID=2545761 RepID=A0A4R4E248_9BACT|nr:DUF6261 family protein [Flaviaesturariibacter aridisoli]TCZ69300.1 hypothetical protein E0486_12350 [Flaviaesturariibacter aridisoli]